MLWDNMKKAVVRVEYVLRIETRDNAKSHSTTSLLMSILTLARSGGGVDATPPHEFFWAGRHTVWRIVTEIFHSLWGIPLRNFWWKKFGTGQVRSRSWWRHKRNNLRKISAKSWINVTLGVVRLTWMGIVDRDWCQYMTGCDPWHMRQMRVKVNWGHLRSLTSVDLTMTNNQSAYA